eukprot:30898-Pelagococcus_subviridis.AAC.17
MGEKRLYRTHLRPELLPAVAAGGARDALVHQRAPEVVAPALEQQRRHFRAHLHPGRLNVLHTRGAEREARDGVDEDALAQRGAAPRVTRAKRRRLEVDERQRHELGERRRVVC